MKKTILQIGLLAFCVSTAVFGTQRLGMIETITRSSIVSIVIVCAIVVVLLLGGSFETKAGERGSTPPAQGAGTRWESAALRSTARAPRESAK